MRLIGGIISYRDSVVVDVVHIKIRHRYFKPGEMCAAYGFRWSSVVVQLDWNTQ